MMMVNGLWRMIKCETLPGDHWLSTPFSGKRCRHEYYSGVHTSFPILGTCDSAGVDTFHQKYAKMSNTVRFIVYNKGRASWGILKTRPYYSRWNSCHHHISIQGQSERGVWQ